MEDSKNRVAVIITDGKKVIVGKSKWNLRKKEHCCDLMKGHAMVGEDLEDAAAREVYEECGLNVPNLELIGGPYKYLKSDTITFYSCWMKELPSIGSLKCNSFFTDEHGIKCPEISQFLEVDLSELTTMLYPKLAKVIEDNGILQKL